MSNYEGMNAYEIVDDLINVKMTECITENELYTMGKVGKVVIAILESEYNATYIEPWDSHCCGSYHFDNPHYVEVKYWSLEGCFMSGTVFDRYLISKTIRPLAEEVVRLDDEFGGLYWDAKANDSLINIYNDMVDKVAQALKKEPHVYVGASRIWKVVDVTMREKPNGR